MSHQILLAKNTGLIILQSFLNRIDIDERPFHKITLGQRKFGNFLLLKNGKREHIAESVKIDINGMIDYFVQEAKNEYNKMKHDPLFIQRYSCNDYIDLVLLNSLMPSYFFNEGELIETTEIKKEDRLDFLKEFIKPKDDHTLIQVFDVY